MKKKAAAKIGLPTTARSREWIIARSISRGPSVPSRRGLTVRSASVTGAPSTRKIGRTIASSMCNVMCHEKATRP